MIASADRGILELSQVQVHLGRRALHQGQRLDQGERHPILADLEVLQRALGLRTPEPVGRNLHFAHRVGFDAELALSWFFCSEWPRAPGHVSPTERHIQDIDLPTRMHRRTHSEHAIGKVSGRHSRLLADAEAAEDPIEDVVGDDRADDPAELVDRQSQIDGDQLIAPAAEQSFRRRPQGRLGAESGCLDIARPSRPEVPSASWSRMVAAIAERSVSRPAPVAALVTIIAVALAIDGSGIPRSHWVQTVQRWDVRARFARPVPSSLSSIDRQTSRRSARSASWTRRACAWSAMVSPGTSIPAVSTSSTVSPSQST